MAEQRTETGASSGAQVRRAVLGEAYANRRAGEIDPFLAPFLDLSIEHVWGGVWNRPGLDVKYRSLVVLSALATLGRLHELRVHLHGALNLGWTAEELREAFLQLSVYAGFPATLDALRVVKEVLDEVTE
jgi:4-carboxymuconolactone decarboxylase